MSKKKGKSPRNKEPEEIWISIRLANERYTAADDVDSISLGITTEIEEYRLEKWREEARRPKTPDELAMPEMQRHAKALRKLDEISDSIHPGGSGSVALSVIKDLLERGIIKERDIAARAAWVAQEEAKDAAERQERETLKQAKPQRKDLSPESDGMRNRGGRSRE